MLNEKWEKLFYNANFKTKYYIDEIIDSEQLIINLSDENGENFICTWNSIVESYMCTEEINRNRLYDIPELTTWSFFEVNNSKYINWLVDESDKILKVKDLHHICIVGINAIVDVIANSYPNIILNEK